MNNDIQRAIDRFNLFQYLTDLDLQFDVSKGGDEYILDCPHCYKHKFSLCADGVKKGVFHCYRCNQAGNLVDLICLIEGITKGQALNKIVGKQEISELKKFDFKIKEIDKKDVELPIPDEIQLPCNFVSLLTVPETDIGRIYAAKRGITESDIRDFGILYSSADKRIIFPIYFENKLVGWQGRDVTGQHNRPKAMTGPSSKDGKGFKKSWVFYGWDRIKNERFVTVVEGPIDAIHGKNVNSIAILGKEMSNIQFKRLISLKNCNTVFIALDPDATAERQELANRLRPFFKEVRLVNIPKDRDFGDSDDKSIKEYLYNSTVFKHNLFLRMEERS